MLLEMPNNRMKPERERGSARFSLPRVVFEMEPGFVAAAKLDRSSRRVRCVEVRELEPDCVTPLSNGANITNEAAVRRAVGEVATIVGNGGGKLGLLLPDASVRLALLRFETLPEDAAEAKALVRWRMREVLPYPPEEARVCYQVLSRESDAVEVMGLAIRSSILAEYEAALESLNGGPSLILPATLALLPLLPEDVQAGQLLVHVFSGSLTLVVVVENRVRFWRNRLVRYPSPEETSGEVTREVARVLATCHDHLKIEIERVWVCARPPEPSNVGEEVASMVGRDVQQLAGGAGHAVLLPPAQKELFERFGMPFAGLLANTD